MDLRKIKSLIDLVSESDISELEITENEGKVRIVKAPPAYAQATVPVAVLSPTGYPAHTDEGRHGVVYPGGLHPGGLHPGGLHPGGLHAGGLHAGGLHAGGLHAGGPHPGGLHSGAAHPAMSLAPPLPASLLAPSAAPAPAAILTPQGVTGASAAAEAPEAAFVVKSPMVGTFYRASQPGAEPFVQVGSKVTESEVVCLIEAMKLLNEIEAGKAGMIKAVLVENGQPVEYGQPLFLID